MKDTFQLPVLLEDLRRYLVLHGWQQEAHPNERIRYFATKPDEHGDFASLMLPASESFSDARNRAFDAVQILAEYEQKTSDETFRRIHRWDKDVLRARILSKGENLHSLPLEVAADAIVGLKELIGYAAYTETDPKPSFDRAGSISKEFVKNCSEPKPKSRFLMLMNLNTLSIPSRSSA